MSQGLDKKLIELCKADYSAEEVEQIAKAVEFATKAHEGQLRQSGEPYITHPLIVAEILVSVGVDADCVIAGLLHDVVEDCSVTYADVEKTFGHDVAALVDGVTKLSKTAVRAVSNEERKAENYRKLFVAIARDPRVVIIKLADRLHNMRTLGACPQEKRIRISTDTMQVFAPIAHRFGIGTIKCELEDLAFKYLKPDEYAELKMEVDKQQSERMELLNDAKEKISKELDVVGIKHKINGRPKHLYSIYRKMQAQDVTLEGIYDLVALRIIVGTVGECYAALGLVHGLWKPIPGRLKDYISTPKPNMYQSIHTSLFSDNGIPFEVQIRTQEMHRAAEYGVAAHWLYKEKRDQNSYFDKILSWLREMMEYQDITTTASEFVAGVQNDFFSDYVFVATPQGEVIDLPMGSTPLDFAYRIHTDIGHRAIRAKVNGSIVRFDYVLKTNDVVEIETGTVENPSRNWLNIVKTQQAKAKIKQWFKKVDRDDNLSVGKDILVEALHKQSKSLSDFAEDEVEETLKKFGFSRIDDLCVAIGRGSIAVTGVISKLLECAQHNDLKDRLEEQINRKMEESASVPAPHSSCKGVIVPGFPSVAVNFAHCCNPLPGDAIFGYVTKGRGVSVHRADCANARSLQTEEGRRIPVEWTIDSLTGAYIVYVNVLAKERKGLLADVSQALFNVNIDIKYINADTDTGGKTATVRLAFEIEDLYRLKSVINQLETVDSVIDVYRVNG